MSVLRVCRMLLLLWRSEYNDRCEEDDDEEDVKNTGEKCSSRQELHHPVHACPHHGRSAGAEDQPREDRRCFTEGCSPEFIRSSVKFQF